MTLEGLTEFFGWCALINLALLLFSTTFMVVLREPLVRIHSRLFGLSAEPVRALYLNVLAQYKLAVWMFSVTPYLALRLMA